MKNRTAIAVLAIAAVAGSATAQGLHPISDVRTVEAATSSDTSERDTRIMVEVPTMDRLNPFQRFVINPYERQNDPARFEIRVDGTIRNYANATNGFVRAQRYVADRLEEARIAWLRENAAVASHAGEQVGSEAAAITPRATITMPEGASGGGGFRVQAPKADRARLVAALERMEAHRAAARATTEPERETAVASAD
ncbi:MAG: hypothetical protein ACIAS6_04470 [Phycisphaerales bacterium JB060]